MSQDGKVARLWRVPPAGIFRNERGEMIFWRRFGGRCRFLACGVYGCVKHLIASAGDGVARQGFALTACGPSLACCRPERRDLAEGTARLGPRDEV